MTSGAYSVALVGLGRIGFSYAEDPRSLEHYRFLSHSQVLAAHPQFELTAIMDIDHANLERARSLVDEEAAYNDLDALARHQSPDVLVVATPPIDRLEIVERFPDVKAVIVEKPLGKSLAESAALASFCAQKSIPLFVNYWRRFDPKMLELAEGGLQAKIGDVQCVNVIYGNGLLNNGSHAIDLLRMLLGEITDSSLNFQTEPDQGEVPLSLRFENGSLATLSPIDFRHYREIYFDFWGTRGRLEILQEGLRTRLSPCCEHRALSTGDLEVDSLSSALATTGARDAFYHLYSHVADVLQKGVPLRSSGANALTNEKVIHSVMRTAQQHATAQG